tara:strand:+ start:11441 stop:11728 length:288 start_codon:yes stop_codon:yes gene_type:complete
MTGLRALPVVLESTPHWLTGSCWDALTATPGNSTTSQTARPAWTVRKANLQYTLSPPVRNARSVWNRAIIHMGVVIKALVNQRRGFASLVQPVSS